MMKRNYNMKKTISIKQFITEFGQGFSKHMKQRLLELGTRLILTRRELSYILDLKHVEHLKYDCHNNSGKKDSECKKEYTYGQFVVNEGSLYFSENCLENNDIMQISIVKDIYSSLTTEENTFEDELKAKLIDDNNIDYVADKILEVCPEVSAEHMAIIAKYCTVESRR
ncbi:MAG: hypothetical protein WBL93_13045 [Lutisporaceae bacterium]